jgi:hypothetical protein
MIAPIRQTGDQPGELAGARRAVAEMMFQGPTSQQQDSTRSISKRAGWMLVAWAAAVTLIYLVRSSR